MTDGQLLEGYVTRNDQGAFRDLVARHGPAVLRTCRGVLGDREAAEDAFQATFLVLVARAPSIREPERLGGWLVGVARRVASRSRRREARRYERERRKAEMSRLTHESDRDRGEGGADLRRVLREEMDRLPESYREPLELCYLEGLTHEQAARRLGWPVGTVKVRLVRSRRLLRERLSRRGAALAALLLLLRPGRASAIPDGLAASTAEAMTLKALGEDAVLASRFPKAAALADGIAGAWRPAARRWPLLATLAVALLGAGGAVLAYQAGTSRPDEVAALPANLTDLLNLDCR